MRRWSVRICICIVALRTAQTDAQLVVTKQPEAYQAGYFDLHLQDETISQQGLKLQIYLGQNTLTRC